MPAQPYGGYGITVITPVCGTGNSGSIPDSHPNVYTNVHTEILLNGRVFVWYALDMINQELIDYIKKELSKEKTNEEIRSGLISDGGWKDSDINEAFSSLNAGQISSVPQKPDGPKKNTSWKPILGVLVVLILLMGVYLFFPKTEVVVGPISTPEPVPTEPQQDTGVPSIVVSRIDNLLTENNIRLSYLLSSEGGSASDLVYQSSPTGYEFVLNERSKIEENVGFDSTTIVRAWYDVYYNNLPVFNKSFNLSFMERDNSARSNRIRLDPITISSEPTITKSEARRIALDEQPGVSGSSGVLGYYAADNSYEYSLVWVFDSGPVVRLDANTGEVLYSWNGESSGGDFPF
jgi:hypothetical protein